MFLLNPLHPQTFVSASLVAAAAVFCTLSPAVHAAQTAPPSAPAAGSPFARGMDAYRKGDLDTARTLLQQAVKAEPNNGEAESVLGYLLVRAGDAAGAVPHLERAVTLRPDIADAYTNLGNALLLRVGRTPADTERAVQMFEKAATLAPESAEAQVSLGYAYARTNRFDRAAAAYRRATDLRPKDAKAWTNLGLALRRLNKHAEAAEALQKAATLAPQDATAWTALGEAALDRGDTTAATNALETARKLDAKNYPAALGLAKAYAAANRFAEAAEAYGAAADLAEAAGKPDAALRYNQGVSLGKVNRLEEAGAAYEKALTLNPRYYDALVNSGFVQFRQNRTDEAVARFQTAAEVRPNAALAWRNLAAAQARRKDWTAAAAAWKRVITLEPNNDAAYEARASALLNASRSDEAVLVYKQLAARRPASADPLIALGLAYQRQAETETTAARKQALLVSALQSFQAAIKRNPRSAVAYNDLGVVHERRGELPEALAAYKKAVALDPKLTDAQRNLARFKVATQKPTSPSTEAP